MQWLDAIIQGVLLGGMYAQYALGMALMFGVMRIVNIAHGDVMILLSLIAVSLAGVLPVGNIGLIVVIVPIAVAIGWALQTFILNRVVGADPLPSLIATFGLSIALQNLMLEVWSADTRSLPNSGIASESFQIGPIYVGLLPVIVLICAFVLTGGLDAVMRYTRFGRGLRAAAADTEAAAMTGVDPKRIYATATAIAVGILGLAAVFAALRATVSPSDGSAQLIYAFEAVIIGGMGSIWGAFLGSMVLGVAQAIGLRVDPGLGILFGHLVFLLVLATRPEGIMARKK
ncbi:High-affinity branched-chain amino acid transport system permease protein LivH [Pseudooceanicola marinus]|uniref:High-affinity branched-chain amino acid transport system permease protein LivH n=1 Tax=Pseudooceanicola marinus TaxID=396013 RepID=A0A1X6YLQ1_9RHOB|nr:branched-chain amino acid ABC transporter permease [Pseudooceanicola marinus]PJE29363.1 branched-chain amino acid ABC transporter permease [Pseudooceanicola marinus]SLN24929.1 High-affinity branched-chain amino acid transport system permease protein LivH [Pseudooceanicola marinus]